MLFDKALDAQLDKLELSKDETNSIIGSLITWRKRVDKEQYQRVHKVLTLITDFFNAPTRILYELGIVPSHEIIHNKENTNFADIKLIYSSFQRKNIDTTFFNLIKKTVLGTSINLVFSETEKYYIPLAQAVVPIGINAYEAGRFIRKTLEMNLTQSGLKKISLIKKTSFNPPFDPAFFNDPRANYYPL